uniref:Uncharacterized protein n=1 Tax=Zea mays TaxID=4577 RepID=A0A804PMY2_MAIZE
MPRHGRLLHLPLRPPPGPPPARARRPRPPRRPGRLGPRRHRQVHRQVRDARGGGAERGRAGRGLRQAGRLVGAAAGGDQGASGQARGPALHRGLRHASPPLQVQRQAQDAGGLQRVRCPAGGAAAAPSSRDDHHAGLLQRGRDGDILQEGRRHDGGQPLGVAPHGAGDARRDQHRGRAHHLPPQGRAWRRLPFARHQPLPQIITRCGRRRSASCPSARAPTGSRAPARRFISARSVPSSMSAQHRRLSLSCRSLGCGCTWRARNTTG